MLLIVDNQDVLVFLGRPENGLRTFRKRYQVVPKTGVIEGSAFCPFFVAKLFVFFENFFENFS